MKGKTFGNQFAKFYASNTVANVVQTRAEGVKECGKRHWKECGKGDEQRQKHDKVIGKNLYLQVQKPQTPGITIINAPPTPDLQGNPIL